MSEYAGADWLAENLRYRDQKLSEFGRQIADILGWTFRGIYHVSEAVMAHEVNWASEECVEVALDRELASHDGDELAQLFLRCADAGIRMAVRTTTVTRRYEGTEDEYEVNVLSVIFHKKDTWLVCGSVPRLEAMIERILGKQCGVDQQAGESRHTRSET